MKTKLRTLRKRCQKIDFDRVWRGVLTDQRGMTTIEYALGTLVAAALVIILLTIVRGGMIQDALQNLISNALNSVQ